MASESRLNKVKLYQGMSYLVTALSGWIAQGRGGTTIFHCEDTILGVIQIPISR